MEPFSNPEMEYSPAKAAVAAALAEHFRALNQPAEIPVSRNLSQQVGMLMCRARREVEINSRRTRDNNRLWALNNPRAARGA